MRELEFLTIGAYPQYKELYLQHINQMINIKLVEGDTHLILFEKLKGHFKNNTESLKAVEKWITFNKECQEDESVFETILCEESECYVSFNLR